MLSILLGSSSSSKRVYLRCVSPVNYGAGFQVPFSSYVGMDRGND